MTLTADEHLDNLVRHIDLVRGACILLGKRLIAAGESELGRNLISRGFRHDVTKFHGIEWKYLHAGSDIPMEKIDQAREQHVLSNDHHPEYWGGFQHMPEIAIAEMACDWYGRGMEFGTDLRKWIEEEAIQRYKIDTDSVEWEQLNRFVNMLLLNHFVKDPPKKQRKKK